MILAGGRSKRMGQQKAFLLLRGRPIFEYVLETCRSIFDEIIVVARHTEAFGPYRVKVFEDLIDAGVLGGLYTGLLLAPTPYVFCVACDMPFLRQELVHYLLSIKDGYDAIVPRAPDGLHPLCAIYHRNCLGPISEGIAEGQKRVISFLPRVRAKICDPEEIRKVDPDFLSFFNINTPEDFAMAERMLSESRLHEMGI